MARCFITGVDLQIEEAWVLDLGPAYRVQRELKQRLEAVDRLIRQLAPQDDVQVYNSKTRTAMTMKHRRVVSAAVAKVLCAAWHREPLFIAWSQWRARRQTVDTKSDIVEPERTTAAVQDSGEG